MKYLKLLILLMFFNSMQYMSAHEFRPGYIEITGNIKTNLKVSTETCKVSDMEGIGHGFDYRYIKPSNDSSFLKQVRGIIIDSALINRLDESFFELRMGDTLDGIFITNTKFDYVDLINNLIRYNIKLSSLSIDLKYLNNFPDNIEKLLGLKMLMVNFGRKNIDIKLNVFEIPSLKDLVLINANKIKNINSNIRKIIHLQTLAFYNCDSVLITNEIIEKKELNNLTLINNIILKESYKNIENCEQLESLTIENCKLLDNQIKFDKLTNLKFLNLRNNNLTNYPEEVLYLNKLSTFLFLKNKIKHLPFDIILKLPKREKSIYLEISDTFLNLEDKMQLKAIKASLDANGYNFHCFDYYSGASQKY